MFKTDTEIATLLDHPRNILHRSIGQGKTLFFHSNGKGSEARLTIQDKAEIGILATLVGVKNAAELTGEDPANVSRMKNGKNTYDGVDAGTKAAMNNKLAPIQSKAIDKVDMLLDLIREDRAGDLSVKDAAITAEKLTSVYEKLAPAAKVNIEKANVIFYSPAKKEVSDYPIIDVEPAVG